MADVDPARIELNSPAFFVLHVPEGWEAPNPPEPSAAVTGRGYLTVTHLDAPWDPTKHSEILDIIDGPTPVTIKLYRLDGGTVAETGTTTVVQQYRYSSSDPNTWNRQIVWVLQRNGTTTVAEIGYPEFPEDSTFSNPADPINLALTGLDPIDLLKRHPILRIAPTNPKGRTPQQVRRSLAARGER